MKLRIAPAKAQQCTYAACKAPAAGELRAHLGNRPGREPWPMCKRHVKPEAHPPDLRDKLFRWDEGA